MTTHELARLVDLCEQKYEEFVFVKMYGDGSGGLYAEQGDDPELITWDEEKEIEKTLREWLKK